MTSKTSGTKDKNNGTAQPPETKKIPAVVCPAQLWVQMVDLLRDTPLPHKQVDPILQQAGQLQPQEVEVSYP